MKVKFSDPDQHGQVHANIELALDHKEKSAYVELEINDRPAAKYHLTYQDSGTVGYARMQGQYAIHGTLTNVTMNWAKDDPYENWGIINAIGTIDNGAGKLHLWRNSRAL